jgi:hypothetical protein
VKREGDAGVVVSSGAKFKMEPEENGSSSAKCSSAAEGRVDVYLPMPAVTATLGPPLPLPALICQTTRRVTPGAVMQGCLLGRSSE